MTTKEFEKLLKKSGFTKMKGRGKGSHQYWTDGNHFVTVQNHKGDFPKGTLNAMMKQAGLK
ncbi:MAG: type II toxin-antitoxin system HicA family toxin [Allobaculum sp.]|uniref:type II toxin-antitoxin system HicA family toxin n=1 Tax=Allobaculum sp. TaxID=1872463 RepID=UPI00399BF1F7